MSGFAFHFIRYVKLETFDSLAFVNVINLGIELNLENPIASFLFSYFGFIEFASGSYWNGGCLVLRLIPCEKLVFLWRRHGFGE